MIIIIIYYNYTYTTFNLCPYAIKYIVDLAVTKLAALHQEYNYTW